jgi:predicted glycosyl hydrolase (DUF1957 family)
MIQVTIKGFGNLGDNLKRFGLTIGPDTIVGMTIDFELFNQIWCEGSTHIKALLLDLSQGSRSKIDPDRNIFGNPESNIGVYAPGHTGFSPNIVVSR